jgi:hypothetical protein
METNELLESMFLTGPNSVTNSPDFILTGTSTTGIYNVPSTGTYIPPLQDWMQKVFIDHVNNASENITYEAAPETIIDQIGEMTTKLSDSDDQNQINAVKHLTYAKAYLEKMLLDKLNNKL